MAALIVTGLYYGHEMISVEAKGMVVYTDNFKMYNGALLGCSTMYVMLI